MSNKTTHQIEVESDLYNGDARCSWHDNLRDAIRYADANQP